MQIRKKWLKIGARVAMVPVLLFVMLMALLYVPPVQNFLRRQATAMASEATGMDIAVARIDLRFPLNLLVRGVEVVRQPADSSAALPRQCPDTLLTLGSLNVHVQAWPLLKGQVEIDNITLRQVHVNSADLLDGMCVKGVLGEFSLESHGVDLTGETVVLNRVDLSDTHLEIMLADTTEARPDTTASAPVNWKIRLHTLRLNNLSADLSMPLDTMRLSAHLGKVQLDDATADLGQQCYAWRRLSLQGGSAAYDTGTGKAAEGFDAAHIDVHGFRLGIDSAYMRGRELNAVIRECALDERSGLSITSLTGRLQADSSVIRIPGLQLSTPHSQIDIAAQTYWQLVDIPTTGHLTARLRARIGKQDVLLFAGSLPETFRKAYPAHALVIQADTEGNLRQMQLSGFSADLPGAFSLNGKGELRHLTDSLQRSGSLDFDMQTMNLDFLTGLTGVTPDGSIVVPDSMRLSAHMQMEGSRYAATLKLRERQGTLDVDASYDTATDAYHARLAADSLQLHHFLPKDSLYTLSTVLTAEGHGTDLQSAATTADVHLALNELQYAGLNLGGVQIDAALKDGRATARVSGNNSLLSLQAKGDIRLNRPYLDARIDMNLKQADLVRLGVTDTPPEHPLDLRLKAEARHDSLRLDIASGDLQFRFHARNTLDNLLERSEAFADMLGAQLEARRLDHAALRRLLPSAVLFLRAGQENPVSDLLAQRQIGYDQLRLSFAITPDIGINGHGAIEGLHIDTLRLDTLFLAIRQDTTRMTLQGGVVNGPDNPQITFRSTLTGEIRNEDAELTVDYTDAQGETGILFGINARPLTEGRRDGRGLLLQLIPDKPIIAYHPFDFADGRNKIYLHNDMHVYANVDMTGDDGIRFRMLSDPRDTTSLQNIHIELNRFRLDELGSVLPYLPPIGGLLSAKADYIQTESSLQVSANADIGQLTYEGQPVGDIGLDASWMPGEGESHYLNARCTVDSHEVLAAEGLLASGGGTDNVKLEARITRLPLSIANAFVPDRTLTLSGYANGEISVDGPTEKPGLQGSLSLDSASVYLRQMDARFRFDDRPLRFEDGKLLFDKFAIYTTSANPFTIDGNIGLADMSRPTADLRLNATDYTLLDAARTRESMVYGKVCVDFAASVRGPLDAPVMRGNMNLLGTTDVTYVLTDSPLTVENRLEGLVSFTSFADTLIADTTETATMSLGGLDMLLTVHIDDAVRLRADLSPDRSKYVELEGGGDLSLQYTPQGEMSLSGRYTLSGGTMKYSLPIIPLKEFEFTAGSYVDWRGDLLDPMLDLKATERVRASVSNGDDGGSRSVDFDVSISIGNRLSAPELVFDLAAPDDATVENELQSMDAEERSKQAIAMLATGIYLNSGVKGGGLNMGNALNSVLQNQINALAGSALESVNASFSVGVEDRTAAETGDKQTDYSFRYSQRFFNDRVQIVIGGKVSTGANATNDVESFIDNISLEYRLDASGTRYVRVFHDKNYDSVLDGEVTETGVGIVLRRKMDRLSELFIFRKKKKSTAGEPEGQTEETTENDESNQSL